MFEGNDSFRLWTLSAEMMVNIHSLDLVRVLGSRANADEIYHLLCSVERLNFAMRSKE